MIRNKEGSSSNHVRDTRTHDQHNPTAWNVKAPTAHTNSALGYTERHLAAGPTEPPCGCDDNAHYDGQYDATNSAYSLYYYAIYVAHAYAYAKAY